MKNNTFKFGNGRSAKARMLEGGCVCVRACVRACVRVCVCVQIHVSTKVKVLMTHPPETRNEDEVTLVC